MSSMAQKLVASLKKQKTKVVFAESCTGGLAAATMATIPGISEYLCGSAVVYRSELKRQMLGVRRKTIEKFTTESPETAREMSHGVLTLSPEAGWSVSVVGHLGPNAPTDKDGVIYATIMRRSKKGKIKVVEEFSSTLSETNRQKRQEEAVNVILAHLTDAIAKRNKGKNNTRNTRNQTRKAETGA